MLYYARHFKPLTLLFHTGSGENQKLLNITDIAQDLGPKICTSPLRIYCCTGEVCDCAFKGEDKITPLKKLEKRPRFQDCFAKLGDSWETDDKLVDDLEEFGCLMYGFLRVVQFNTVQALLLKMVGEGATIRTSSKVGIAKLPPWQSLVLHMKHANYRVA